MDGLWFSESFLNLYTVMEQSDKNFESKRLDIESISELLWRSFVLLVSTTRILLLLDSSAARDH